MIDVYNCNLIVMICNLMEDGKEKCACYYDEKFKMIKYKIYIENIIEKDSYIIRIINLKNLKDKTEKKINQIHITNWPDNFIPNTQNGEVYNVLIDVILKAEKNKGNGPIVSHCSGGIGRTGTFIAMYYLYKEIKDQIDEKREFIQFSVFNLVRKLKEMRIAMVQNSIQYKFIIYFVYFILKEYNHD
jgi:protein tyrosine phosphatase